MLKGIKKKSTKQKQLIRPAIYDRTDGNADFIIFSYIVHFIYVQLIGTTSSFTFIFNSSSNSKCNLVLTNFPNQSISFRANPSARDNHIK